MKEKLAKLGLNVEHFNIEQLAKMGFKEFETLFKSHSVIGERLKEVYDIFTPTSKKMAGIGGGKKWFTLEFNVKS